MKKINWKLRRYYMQIRSWLPCSWKQKNRFIRELSGNVQTFLEQEPTADFNAIQNHFGTPQQIASAYVDETDTPQLLKGLHVRRKVVATVLTACVLCLIACVIALCVEVSMVSDISDGLGNTEMTIIK